MSATATLRVLVVDDDPMMTLVLNESLSSQGFFCHLANCMDEVTDYLGKYAYDVVLLDLQGGDIDRLRVAEVARAKGARVVTMSGAAELRPMLEKPFRTEDLCAALLGRVGSARLDGGAA